MTMTMTVVYALEELPDRVLSKLFLAGPTPRDPLTPSWRPEALDILRGLGYTGTVLVPEDRSGEWKHSYDDQVTWECAMRQASDIIVFCVPRDLGNMPAFTTNVEFGLDLRTGKMLYGRPETAPKNRYLDHLWHEVTDELPRENLPNLLGDAVSLLGMGAERSGADVHVPLSLWLHPTFNAWHVHLKAAGHVLAGARQLFSWPVPHAGSTPWMFVAGVDVAGVDVEVHGEGRTVSHEIVVGRPDMSAVAAFHDGPDGMRVLLIQEFRSASNNPGGLVVELPGGSSDDANPRSTAAQELGEEAGLHISDDRLVHVGSRQVAPTMLAHRLHLFACLLSDTEVASLHASIGEGCIHGASQHERITLRFPLVSELEDAPVGWDVLGQVQAALHALETASG